jgi:thiamine biosynthesis lipoprotein
MERPDSQPPRHPTRREVLALGVGVFVVGAVPFARSRARLVRRTIPVMGTLAEAAVVHRDERYAHAAIDAAFAELQMVEQRMSRYRGTSDVGRANTHAAREGVGVSDETAAVLARSLHWAEASDGAFDPCLGQATALWDIKDRREPPPVTVSGVYAGRRLFRALDLDTTPGRARVRFEDPAVAIDLGGIGKGYAVDRAVATLRAWGVEHGLVNAGGDLYALGTSEDGDLWKVGIRSPHDPRELSGRIAIADEAIATSGDYLRQFTHAGRRYHHLLDPMTGEPRQSDVHSVTVRAVSCLDADAAATAVFGMDRGRADALARRFGALEIVRTA